MDDIIDAVKGDSGIHVHFRKGDVRYQRVFSIQELIDAHINVYHLIQYPGKYPYRHRKSPDRSQKTRTIIEPEESCMEPVVIEFFLSSY
jgi:hypothetical protein